MQKGLILDFRNFCVSCWTFQQNWSPAPSGFCKFYGHLGIYGYKREALIKMTELAQTPLEKTESLEQLRALENGMKIKTSVVDFVPVGIDTLEDLAKFKEIVAKQLV